MLPILEKKDEIVSLLKKEQVVIISGETGSGKTTQLPQICKELGLAKYGKIAITQPRRIAATSIAKRIAEETKTPLGALVGYKIRFSESISKDTQIICMTDGILLQELVRNPKLFGYSVIIIDEAHERSLNIDLILGYLRKILPKRKDLKIIISSATMDTSLFSKAFNDACVLNVSGRMFPVDVIYDDIESGSEGGYIERAIKSVEKIMEISDFGDVLLFMPTERDILEAVKKLKGRFLQGSTRVLPLFSRLTNAEQNRIFEDTDARKIIVSTNIAETSITIPKIKYVVDTGLVRIAKYAPNLRTNRLPIEEISKAEASQRAGRSGRVSDGVCIRLYSQKNFEGRDEFRVPEIQRLNLAGVILQMLNLNLGDVKNFPFIQPPETRRIDDAINQLYELGAIDEKQNLRLTPIGKTMAKFPLEPNISRMLIQAQREGVSREVAVIAAGLSIVDPRERPAEQASSADSAHQKFTDIYSDFMSLLKIWNVFHDSFSERKLSQRAMRDYCAQHFLSFNRMREWSDVYEQISQTCKEYDKNFGKVNIEFKNLSETNRWAIHKSICAGLLGNIAMFDSEKSTYLATKNRVVHIFPGSALAGGKKRKSQWIMAQQITETSRVFAITLGPIDPKWIIEFVPNLLKKRYGVPFYDVNVGSVVVEETLLFYGLEIQSGQKRFYGNINPKVAREIFIQSALIEENTTRKYSFLIKNRDLINKLRSISDSDLLDFYTEKIPQDIASDNQLTGLIKREKGDGFLTMENENASKYPDYMDVGNTRFNLSYKRNFGKDDDGVTVEIPENEMPFVDKEIFERINSMKMRIKTVPSIGESKLQALLLQKTVKNYEKTLENTQNRDPLAAIINKTFDDYGYPALSATKDGVDIVYYTSPEEAAKKNPLGLAKLLEYSLAEDFGWLERKLRLPQEAKLIAKAYGGAEFVSKRLFEIVRDAVCFPVINVNTWCEFDDIRKVRLEILRRAEKSAVDNFVKFTASVSKVRQYLSKMPKTKSFEDIRDDLEVYVEQFISGYCPLVIFERYFVYIDAFICRIDKAQNSPRHYEECEKTVRYYQDKSVDLVAKIHKNSVEFEIFTERFCYLLEELTLKLFAEPKIKSVENISVKKLETFCCESGMI